jgi:hypothetical protein
MLTDSKWNTILERDTRSETIVTMGYAFGQAQCIIVIVLTRCHASPRLSRHPWQTILQIWRQIGVNGVLVVGLTVATFLQSSGQIH